MEFPTEAALVVVVVGQPDDELIGAVRQTGAAYMARIPAMPASRDGIKSNTYGSESSSTSTRK